MYYPLVFPFLTRDGCIYERGTEGFIKWPHYHQHLYEHTSQQYSKHVPLLIKRLQGILYVRILDSGWGCGKLIRVFTPSNACPSRNLGCLGVRKSSSSVSPCVASCRHQIHSIVSGWETFSGVTRASHRLAEVSQPHANMYTYTHTMVFSSFASMFSACSSSIFVRIKLFRPIASPTPPNNPTR